MEKTEIQTKNGLKCSKAFSRFKKAREIAKAKYLEHIRVVYSEKITFLVSIIEKYIFQEKIINLWIKLKWIAKTNMEKNSI